MNDVVFVRNYGDGDNWMPGTICEIQSPKNYLVQVKDVLWKRHVDQLKLGYIPIGSYSNRSDVDMTKTRYENERVESLLSNNPHAIDFNTHTSNKTVVPSIEKGAEGKYTTRRKQ